MKEFAQSVAIGVLGAVALLVLSMAALWLYEQPAAVRNTVAAVLACLVCLGMAVLFGNDYIQKRRMSK